LADARSDRKKTAVESLPHGSPFKNNGMVPKKNRAGKAFVGKLSTLFTAIHSPAKFFRGV
jgi:hypothetical protein